MTDIDYYVGLTLPYGDYRFIDKSIRAERGVDISTIAEQQDALAAFTALENGLTACYTRRGHTQIVNAKPDLTPTGVIDRQMDGDEAYDGAFAQISHMLVDKMITKFFEEERNVAIEAQKIPGILGRRIGRKPTSQIVAIIPFNSTNRF